MKNLKVTFLSALVLIAFAGSLRAEFALRFLRERTIVLLHQS